MEERSLDVRDEQGSARFCLNALAQATKEAGIAVKWSQIRRICLHESIGFRHPHSWGTSTDKDFVPKEWRSSATTLRPLWLNLLEGWLGLWAIVPPRCARCAEFRSSGGD